jgi:hypothetical protein
MFFNCIIFYILYNFCILNINYTINFSFFFNHTKKHGMGLICQKTINYTNKYQIYEKKNKKTLNE